MRPSFPWCERQDLNLHGCPPDSKSGASASSATLASSLFYYIYRKKSTAQVQKKEKGGKKCRLSLLFSDKFSYRSRTVHTGACSNTRRSRHLYRRRIRCNTACGGSSNFHPNAAPCTHRAIHRRAANAPARSNASSRNYFHSNSRPTEQDKIKTYLFPS